MAYPDNVVISNLGEKQGGSGTLELFLKKFSGEIITMFEEANLLKPYVTMRTLRGAKVAQFPVIGGATAKYFSVGDNILDDTNSYLNSIAHSEKLIYADKKLLSAVMIDEWEELINHYEVRSAYAREMGQALAVEWDYITLINLAIASQASANLTEGSGGSRYELNGTSTATETAGEMKAFLASAAQTLDEKYVPRTGRVAAISPLAYYNLLTDKEVIHRDYNDASNGSLSQGSFIEYLGFKILSSAHVGSATFRTNHNSTANKPGSEGNSYVLDTTNYWGFAWHPSALGAVRVQDLTFEAEYKMEFQAHLMIAKYIMGMGVLRPECVVAAVDLDKT